MHIFPLTSLWLEDPGLRKLSHVGLINIRGLHHIWNCKKASSTLMCPLSDQQDVPSSKDEQRGTCIKLPHATHQPTSTLIFAASGVCLLLGDQCRWQRRSRLSGGLMKMEGGCFEACHGRKFIPPPPPFHAHTRTQTHCPQSRLCASLILARNLTALLLGQKLKAHERFHYQLLVPPPATPVLFVSLGTPLTPRSPLT